MAYSKPWQSYADQLDKLKSRGMVVSDEAMALDYLERIGYYRLSGYWYPMRTRSGQLSLLTSDFKKPARVRTDTIALDPFKEGSTFKRAVDLYVFDKRLRLLALDALERIEVALRVDISHTLGKFSAFAYLQPKWFRPSFSEEIDPKTGLTELNVWLQKHAGLINRSKEEFVAHNKERYGLPLAIWVACEVWDFGTVAKLFMGMREQEQNAIARQYGVHDAGTFATWLRSLNYLRNLCAHHARVWNRNMEDEPKLPASKQVPWVSLYEKQDPRLRTRCFLMLFLIHHLMEVINPQSKWKHRLFELMEDFPADERLDITKERMGVPKNWESFWV